MAMIAHPHLRLDARGVAWIDDAALLDRAGSLGRVLFTRDSDLLTEAGGSDGLPRRRRGAARPRDPSLR